MQEQVNQHKSELWSLSIKDVIYKYIRFLPIFILSVSLALFVAYVYLRYATSVYSTSGTLMIKNDQQSGGKASSKFEDLFMNKTMNIQSEIALIKSKPLMERVVRAEGLQVTYMAKGKIKTVNIYKQCPFRLQILKINDTTKSFSLKVKFLSPNKFTINEEKTVFGFGQTFTNSYGYFTLVRNSGSPVTGEYTIDWDPSYAVASRYAGAIQVTSKTTGTGLLQISMESTNPQLAADVVNQLMIEYQKFSLEDKNETSDQILAFIDKQLMVYGNTLDSVQRRLLDYQQRNNLIDIDVQSNSYFQGILESDKEINQQRTLFNIANSIDDYLYDKKNRFNKVIVPSSLGLEDLTLNELVSGYNKAQLERQQLLESNVPETNPLVTEAVSQIENLRQSIQENLKNIKSTYASVIDQLRRRSSEAEVQAKALPFKVTEFMEIKRQVEALQDLYKYLREKKEETNIQRASNIANSRIIDRALVNYVPIKPNRRGIQIFAVLLGLALPAIVIFVSEILNDKVTTRFDIEKITPVPILGEVGHSYSDKVLIVNKTTRSMVAEQFRIIRSNLQYVLNKSEKAVILITSSYSGEGKSFVSTNMGAVLALAGKKTVILELDIRKPKVLSGLEMAKGPGLTNYLVGKASLEELIRPVPGHEGLFVIGCGPIPPNPSELLLEQRVEEMFVWLRKNFDIVLVDTAPVGMVGDAMTLGKFADCTLYLVRQGHTFKKQIALIDEFYQDNKLPKVSIVINDVKMKPGYGYYGYGRYGYGYGYGYGSYYEEEHPPKTFLERLITSLDFRTWFKKRK